MKYILTATTAALLIAAGSPAQAQVAYTNSALNGCYAHLSTSVGDESGTIRDVVGTFCFDGQGHLLGTSSTPGLTGYVENTNGTVKTGTDQQGTYAVTNMPGDGMGTFEGRCSTHAFAIRNVDANGLAHGLSFILIKRNPKCTGGPDVIGGSAEYQGPLQAPK